MIVRKLKMYYIEGRKIITIHLVGVFISTKLQTTYAGSFIVFKGFHALILCKYLYKL